MTVCKKLIVSSVALLAMNSMVAMAANYSLAPGVVYLNAGHSRQVNTTFSVMNRDTSRLVLKISPLFQAVGSNDKGGPFQNDKALSDAANQFNLMPYVRMSPEKLNIAPNDNRALRVSIRLPGKLTDGTYRVGIDFAQEAVPQEVKVAKNAKPNQLNAVVVPLLDQIGSLYVNIGNGSAQGAQVSCSTVGLGHIKLNVVNNTNYNFNPSVNVYSATGNGQAMTTVIPVPIMPQSEGSRDIQWTTTDQGPYKLTWALREIKNPVTSTIICK